MINVICTCNYFSVELFAEMHACPGGLVCLGDKISSGLFLFSNDLVTFEAGTGVAFVTFGEGWSLIATGTAAGWVMADVSTVSSSSDSS